MQVHYSMLGNREVAERHREIPGAVFLSGGL